MRFKFLFFSIIILLCPLQSYDLKPWFGRWMEFDANIDYRYQNYNQLQTLQGAREHSANDSFLDLKLLYVPWVPFELGFDVLFAKTNSVAYGYDNFGMLMRYLLLDDIKGDPVSLSIGLTMDVPVKRARNDYSQFFHGCVNFEPHISVGKEFSESYYWLYRFWGGVGFGFANRGSPWIRTFFHLDGNFEDKHQMGIYSNLLLGLGSKAINLNNQFTGYSSIKHQTLDIGANYQYTFHLWGSLQLDYSFRVYAFNAPLRANVVTLGYSIPFAPY